jgi:hypothetical protein
MLASQKLAVAAHLHVLLRRKTGRVTDTEWMAQNADYAREIVRFARAKALEDGHPDLAEWAGKLEHALLQTAAAAPKPLVQTAVQLLRGEADAREPATPQRDAGHSVFADSQPHRSGHRKPTEPDAPRYVGGIR